jgi:hypothetical protein
VLICGNFKGTPGATEFTFQGDGQVGNPITLVFDTNAELDAPYWGYKWDGTGGAINISNHSYVIVDGGSDGVIENTANGDNLVYQHASEGVAAMRCQSCIIENLKISNIYVHAENGRDNFDHTLMRCISFSGSNWIIRNNSMHDAGWCLWEGYNIGDGNVSIYNNKVYNIDHGWMLANYGPVRNRESGPFNFYGNQVSGYQNWDTKNNAYHHDGVHCFSGGAGGIPPHITELNIYNNLFDTPVGTHINAHIFIEGGNGPTATPCADSTSRIDIYNNVLRMDQLTYMGLISAGSGDLSIYNNTILGVNTAKGNCFNAFSTVSHLRFENNAVARCNILIFFATNVQATIDHNSYGEGGGNSFVCNKEFLGPDRFSRWKSCIGGDAHSSYSPSLRLSERGLPQPHSPAIRAGANLTYLGIPALNKDALGNPRPATGPWDVGAFQYVAQ